ncbi:MAG: ATP cone domain-containing protein, partial [Erysipelotrichaceae bacterium]
MYRVLKRDGTIVDFNLARIENAIRRAFEASNTVYNEDVIDFLALKVTADFSKEVKNSLVDVETIQDSVEKVLIKGDYNDVAKAYILYRKQHEKMRNMTSTILDYKDLVNSYVK